MDVPGGSVTAVAALVADHPDWLSSNSLSPNDIAVTALGTGESYAAWLATAVESPTSVVVVRVARRPGPELPASPREEFAGLSLAPAGVGPTPCALAALGPFPVIVESLVPGQIRTGRYWADPSLLAAHARTLARLHRRRWLAAGPVTACASLSNTGRAMCAVAGFAASSASAHTWSWRWTLPPRFARY